MSAAPNPVTAVDIVLEPDATMIQNAQAANAGLLKNFPKGFALGDEHAPHMSVIGGYFYTANLDDVFAGESKVLASEKVMSWKLTAFKYYYIPLKEIGLGGILVQPTADLIRLQDELFDAIGKYFAPASSGTAAAFETTPENPEINQPAMDAVATYFAAHRGEHYSPHVTIGVGTVDYLNALLAAPFPTFTFSAAGASAYQFGNFGTAAKQLHSFKLTH
ncbi:MAG: hypothetical protein WA419_19730 [Silvibacterium sp.]